MKLFPRKTKSENILRFAAFFIVMNILTFSLIGCNTFRTFMADSKWGDREIIVDGNAEDWAGALFYADKENISLGFFNDEDNLNVCLIAEDIFTRNQIMGHGLTIWFDPHGGKDKVFGIKCPIGMQPGDFQRPPEAGEQSNKFEDFSEEDLKKLEIIGPEKGKRKELDMQEARGIVISVNPSSGMLVYELKIPLVQKEQNPYAVGSLPGNIVGIGFETVDSDTSNMSGPARGMPGGGGRPGIGGRPGSIPGGGMGGPGLRPDLPKPLKIWAIVRLASDKSHQPSEMLFSSEE